MTGSIVKVSENKYRIFISNGFKLDGKRDRRSKTITTDLRGRDLKRFLDLEKVKFENEVAKKDPKFDNLSRGTLEYYYNWWIDYKTEHEDLQPTTKLSYDKMMRNRINPFAGNSILERLTTGDMLELMSFIRNSPAKTKSGKLSVKSVKHHHTLLNVMFNDAVKLKILSESPMENISVKAPPVKVKDNFYNLQDIRLMLTYLTKYNVKHQLAVLLTMSVGNRIGELSALKWRDIDLQYMKINIDKTNAYTPEKGSYIKDTPKTLASERMVAFPPVLVNLFLKYREDEIMKKELAGRDWLGPDDIEDNFLFTQNNGKPMFVGSLPKWFRKFIRRHNLKHITFHGLRHTNSTVLIGKGVNIVSVSHNLGHNKVSTTTDLYSHHLQEVEREISAIFNEIIEVGTQSGSDIKNLRLVK